ncbi:GIY-YIG nuclease family protein [Bacillus xiapuensis]|uniref:GIY-YIG nuclease family protein n=1 Tax=Bacillus xiapuensis TaxID=2014075 RepID=A0ABU6N485_9BACI|nr:GIY-YIG nuclease family protein [Bacillus xiapuensis]
METNNHFFYVLTCGDGSFYGGYTNNLNRRLKLHKEGKGAKYTRGRGPLSLTFFKTYDNQSDALKAEYQFKQLTRKKKIEFLLRETGGYDVAAEEL